MSPITRQAVFTIALLPIMFGLWFAAGSLLAGPGVWLANQLLTLWLPDAIAQAALDGTNMVVRTHFGELNGQITDAETAGYQLAVQINTRLVSYAMPFYAALLWASNLDNALEKFARGLFVIWLSMAFGLSAIALKDLMLVIGTPFMSNAAVPSGTLIALCYQFSVLLMPSLIPVALWMWQLKGSPLWSQLEAALVPAATKN